MRVLKLRRSVNLPQEPIRSERGRNFGTEDLNCDRTPMFEIIGEVHGCHATMTELPVDGIPVRKRHTKPIKRVGQPAPRGVRADASYGLARGFVQSLDTRA